MDELLTMEDWQVRYDKVCDLLRIERQRTKTLNAMLEASRKLITSDSPTMKEYERLKKQNAKLREELASLKNQMRAEPELDLSNTPWN